MISRTWHPPVLVLVVLSCWTCWSSSHVAQADYVAGRAFDRFITIWLENQDFVKVKADPDFQSLMKSGITLTNYYGLTHPSQPNYIASVSGDYFGLNHDGLVTVPENVSTVVDLFDTKKVTWRVYMEDAPGPGYMAEGSTDGNGKWIYVRKHHPLVQFASITNNGSRLLNLLSLEAFRRDLRDRALPQYAHLSPNMLNDGHNTSLPFATRWAKDFLEPLFQDEYFMRKTLILLTYDESETYSKPNKIISLLLGGALPTTQRGTTDDTFYTHYSILSTLENNWALPNLGRYDVGANVFDLVAKQTGYRNHAVNGSTVDLSVSYPGLLNRDHSLDQTPPPNPFLRGAGGQGILPTLPDHVRNPPGGNVNTPYDGSNRVFDGNLSPPISMMRTASSSSSSSSSAIKHLPIISGAFGAIYIGLFIYLFFLTF